MNGRQLTTIALVLAAGWAHSQFPTIADNPSLDYLLDSSSNLPALTGAATTSASAIVTVADTTGLLAGDAISGTGIPTGSTIVSVDSGTQVTISANATATASGLTLTASHPVTPAASGLTRINSFKTTDTTHRILEVGAGNTLRVGEEGSVRREPSPIGSVDRLTVKGGTLTAGPADDAPGTVLFTATGTDTSTDGGRMKIGLVVDSVVADNGAGAVTVEKSGNQIAVLTGPNTYSGGTKVISGYLRSTLAGNLGCGAIYAEGTTTNTSPGVHLDAAGEYTNAFVVAGEGTDEYKGLGRRGAIWLGGGADVAGPVTLTGDTRITAIGAATPGIVSGPITGDYALEFGSGRNTAQGTMVLSNPGNDWGGDTRISTGGTSGSGYVTLRLAAAEVIPNGPGKGNVVFGQAGNVNPVIALELHGYDETINGLGFAGTNGLSYKRYVRASTSASVTLTVGDGDADDDFCGQLLNGSGTLNLTKTGAGTQRLSNSSSYTGATRVRGGTLHIDGAGGALTGTSSILVDESATFAYSSAIALGRPVTLDGGTFRYSSPADCAGTLAFDTGTLAGTNWNGSVLSGLEIGTDRVIAPGDGVGTAYTAAQAWSDGGAYAFEITNAVGTAGESWDTLDVAGALDLTGLATAGGFTVRVTSLAADGTPGEAQDFDPKESYAWTLATFDSLSGSFSPGLCAVDATGFENETKGSFRVVLDGNALLLTYAPERGTLMLVR